MSDNELFNDGLRFLQKNKSFLGREFLTWLWFTSESQKHKIDVPGLGNFKFYLDDKLVLSATSGSVHENALKGGTPGYADEAHAALRTGKLVQEAKFILHDGKRQWTWGMKADDLSLRGVRLPPVPEPEPGAYVIQRISLMQTLIDVLDHLYKKYVSIRMTAQFKQEMEKMSFWLSTKEGAVN